VYSVSMYSLFADLGLVGTWYGIALAHTVLCLPFVIIVLTAGLKEYDIDQETAAIGLGASRLVAIRRITIPQIRSSLFSAAFLAFITSFDELVVAMFLSGTFGTLPKKMFDNIRLQIDPTIAAVSVLEIVMVVVVMFVLLRMNKGKASRLA
jgi:putative spermidine/putrescine transport system permease protein